MVRKHQSVGAKHRGQRREELLSLVGRNRDKLCEGMTEQQQADLAKYEDCVNEMYGLIEQEVFVHGFRLGARIMLETLMEK